MKNSTKIWFCLCLMLPFLVFSSFAFLFTVSVAGLMSLAFSFACYCGICYFTDETCVLCGNDLMPGFSSDRSLWSRITTARKVGIASGYSHCKECLEEEEASK